MDTVGKRLTYLIESKGVNKSRFCEKYAFLYSSFAPITNDKRTIGINIIKDLMIVFPTLNINWLLFGTGEINYIKNDILSNKSLIVNPEGNYIVDPVEKTFLKYLERESVREKIKKIILDEEN
jgi:hypothetical protein